MTPTRLTALSDAQIRRSTYTSALMATLLPPFVGGSIMGLVGFYPLPEFYLIFTNNSVILYVGAAVLLGLAWATRTNRFIINLTKVNRVDAQAMARERFSRLPWLLLASVTTYSIGGTLSADFALEAMGVRNYSIRDHIYNQLGLIPVVLVTAFPIFFFFFDRLGRYLAPRGIAVNAIPQWLKLVMLGIVTPLLIDSVLIGYYVNRTGHLNWETLSLWFALASLAAGGTWLAWRSLRQGIAPLQKFIESQTGTISERAQTNLTPMSLDELGMLTSHYAELLGAQDRLSGELQRTEMLANSVIDHAGALVVVLDREGRIRRFNQACEKLSGYSFAEVEGKFPWDTVLPPEDAETIRREAFVALSRNVQPTRGRYTNYWLSKNGDRYLIDWSNAILQDKNGKMEFMISVGTDVTDRQRTEETLRTHSDILHAMAEGVNFSDDQGIIRYTNPAFDLMFGYSPGELIGKPIHLLNARTQAENERLASEILEALVRGEKWHGEVINRRKDGSVFITKANISSMIIAGKRWSVTVQEDISERKHAEEKLSRSEQQLRHSQALAHVGSWELDLVTDTLIWSQETARIFGRELGAQDNNYAAFLGAVHPADREAVDRAYQASLRNRTPYEIIHRIVRPDNTIRWVQERGVTSYNEQGNAQRTVGAAQDITEQKEADEALRSTTALLNSVIENIPLMIFMKRADDLRFTLLNRAGEQLLGLNRSELIGKNDYDLFPSGQADFFTSRDRHVLAEGGIDDTPEEPIDTRLQGRRILHTRKISLVDASGKPAFLLGISEDITDRKTAEDALHANNQLVAAVFDTTPVMIAYLDTDMNFIRVNAAYAAADNKSPDYFVGKNHFTLFPNAENEAIFRRVATTGVAHHARAKPFEYEHNPERGVSHWDWSLAPIRSEDGEVLGLVLSLTNVTDRIQALEEIQRKEIALRNANESLELRVTERTRDLTEANNFNSQILMASLLGVAVYRDTGECVFANEAIARLVNATIEQVSAQNFYHIPSWKRSGMLEAAITTLESGKNFTGDFHVTTSFGREAWFECAFTRFFQGGRKHILLMISDTTARKKAEAELGRQYQRTELILSTTLDGFFAADPEGNLRHANPAFCDMLGYTQDELLRMKIPEIEANESPEDVAAHIKKVIEFGHDRFDSRHRRKDGTLVDVEVSVNLVEVGREKMFYAFTRDITPRKIAEAELIRARNLAERANRAKNDFLSRMSHELRTPMNAILGFAQVLEAEELPGELQDYIHEIHHAGDHLLELINDLLDLSRIESGKIAIVIRPVSLQHLVSQSLQFVKSMAIEKGITVLNNCSEDSQLLADETRFRQILVNLIGNAIKYNRPGGRVTIECRNARDNLLRLTVTDTGQGIPPEKLQLLFQPFERLGAEKSAIEGTGIGLAISKQFAELMGASLGVDSVPGQGSSFWIEIPCAGAITPMPAPGTTAATAVPSPSLYSILYIEDNPANLKVVEAMLRNHSSHKLLSATNGEFGIELAKRYRPDVILLDIHLPGMDGYAVLEVLKADADTREIPVIALSADAMPIDIEKGLEAGFTDYLTKPVKVGVLLEALRKILDERTSPTPGDG